MMAMAAGSGMTMPSLTAGILTSVPRDKAGVGSAVNDTTREVGGAVGIAIVGSVVTSIYRSNIATTLHKLAAFGPQGALAAAQARKSIGRTPRVAAVLRTQAGNAVADKFLVDVRHAFVAGLHTGMRVGAALVFVAAIVIVTRYPTTTEA